MIVDRRHVLMTVVVMDYVISITNVDVTLVTFMMTVQLRHVHEIVIIGEYASNLLMILHSVNVIETTLVRVVIRDYVRMTVIRMESV